MRKVAIILKPQKHPLKLPGTNAQTLVEYLSE